MVSFESLGTISYSPSIVTMAVSCIISEIKRLVDSKIAIISYTPIAFDAPVRRFLSECHKVWYGETIIVGLLNDGKMLLVLNNFINKRLKVKSLVFEKIAFLHFGDRQTDRQTDKQMDSIL